MKKRLILSILSVLALTACAGSETSQSLTSSSDASSNLTSDASSSESSSCAKDTSSSESSSSSSSVSSSSQEETSSSKGTSSSSTSSSVNSSQVDSSSSSQVSSSVVEKFTVEVTNGTVNGLANGEFEKGTSVTVTANTPEEGYQFSRWVDEQSNEVSKNNPYTFNVEKNIKLKAEYEKIKVTLIVEGGEGGGTYDYGTSVQVTATLSENQTFVRWEDGQGTQVSTENPYTFEIKADTTLKAVVQTKDGISKPTSMDEFEALINGTSLEKEKLIASGTYTLKSNYADREEQYTFYSNGKLSSINNKKQSSQSSEFKGIVNGDYVEVDFKNNATRKKIVETVNNSDGEILESKAKENFETLGLVKFIKDKSSYFKGNLYNPTFNCELKSDAYEVSLTGFKDSTSYGPTTYEMKVVLEKDGFINSITYAEKEYASTDKNSDGNGVKDNATPTSTTEHTYVATKGERSNAYSEDLSKYFISSYDFYFNVSFGTDTLKINKDNKKVPLNATWYKSSFNMENKDPSTAIEDDDLTFVSSSNTEVIDVDSSSSYNPPLKAKGLGQTTLTVRTKYGIEKTLEVEVEEFAPKTITINADSTVNIEDEIELSVNVNPTIASDKITWSLDSQDYAELVEKGGKTYLKGKAAGSVTLKATSTIDPTKYGEKTITVIDPNAGGDTLSTKLIGTWKGTSQSFTIEFKAEGTYVLKDDQRAVNKISNRGSYTITETKDVDFAIFEGEDTKCGAYEHPEGVVVSTTNRVMFTKEEETKIMEGVVADLHFVISEDGTQMTMHYKWSKDASTISVPMSKQ